MKRFNPRAHTSAQRCVPRAFRFVAPSACLGGCLMSSCKLGSVPMSCLRRGLSVALGLLLAILMSHSVLAQTFSASIAGTVTDTTGAVVRGANLQLENADTKDTRVQTSADD